MAEIDPDKQSWLGLLLRNPLVVGLAVLGALSAAFQLAGLTTMALANALLICGFWIFLTVEAGLSMWIRRTGLYRRAIILGVGGLTGIPTVYLSEYLRDTKREQQWEYSGIAFKTSPLLTAKRQKRIKTDLWAFRLYMEGLGFDVSSMPNVGIVDSNNKGEMGGALSSSVPAYYDTVDIHPAYVDDPPFTTVAYSEYTVARTLNTGTPKGGKSVEDIMTQLTALHNYDLELELYFNWSFWSEQKPPWPTNKVLQAFWHLRSLLGQDRTDRILAYTVKGYASDPTRDLHVPPAKFLYMRMQRAYAIVYSDNSQWSAIEQILNHGGIHP